MDKAEHPQYQWLAVKNWHLDATAIRRPVFDSRPLSLRQPSYIGFYKVSPPRFSCLPQHILESIQTQMLPAQPEVPGDPAAINEADQSDWTNDVSVGSKQPEDMLPDHLHHRFEAILMERLEEGFAIRFDHLENTLRSMLLDRMEDTFKALLLEHLEDLTEEKLWSQQENIRKILIDARTEFENKYALHPLCYARDPDLQEIITGLKNKLDQLEGEQEGTTLRLADLSANAASTWETFQKHLDTLKKQVEEVLSFIGEQEAEKQKAQDRLFIKFTS